MNNKLSVDNGSKFTTPFFERSGIAPVKGIRLHSDQAVHKMGFLFIWRNDGQR